MPRQPGTGNRGELALIRRSAPPSPAGEGSLLRCRGVPCGGGSVRGGLGQGGVGVVLGDRVAVVGQVVLGVIAHTAAVGDDRAGGGVKVFLDDVLALGELLDRQVGLQVPPSVLPGVLDGAGVAARLASVSISVGRSQPHQMAVT